MTVSLSEQLVIVLHSMPVSTLLQVGGLKTLRLRPKPGQFAGRTGRVVRTFLLIYRSPRECEREEEKKTGIL